MSDNRHHTWTKEAWLAYKAWAEEWIAYQLAWWSRISKDIRENIIEQMMDRED